jgi:hypothetical protein
LGIYGFVARLDRIYAPGAGAQRGRRPVWAVPRQSWPTASLDDHHTVGQRVIVYLAGHSASYRVDMQDWILALEVTAQVQLASLLSAAVPAGDVSHSQLAIFTYTYVYALRDANTFTLVLLYKLSF